MRAAAWVAAMLVAGLLSVPLSGAEDVNTLFLTSEVITSGGECSINRDYVLSDTPPDAGRAYVACSLGGAGYYTYFTHTTTEDLAIDGPLRFDGILGCDPAAVFSGASTVLSSYRTILHIGSQNSGNINGFTSNLCTGQSSFVAEHDFGAQVIPAGTAIRIQFLVFAATPSGAERGVVYLATGPEGSQLHMPGPAPAAPEPAEQTVHATLDAPAVNHTFANATSDTYLLNFTTDLVNGTADFMWNATAGSVNATLTDANGTTLFSGMFEGNGSLAHDVHNATAGPWNLTLAYSGFHGSFSFALAAPATGPDGADPGTDGETDTGGPADNGTADPDDTEPADTPVPLLLTVVALLVATCRRRFP